MSGWVGPKKATPPSVHSALAGTDVLSGEAPAVQHTPGRLVRRDTPDYAELFATDPRAGSLTAQIAMVARAEDADRIALCWNAHDELVAAGKELLEAFDNTKRDAHDRACRLQLAVASIRDAVAKVTGSAIHE